MSQLYASFFTVCPTGSLPSLVQAVAKTSAAPIERIKLLVQNQDEMVRRLYSARCPAHMAFRSSKAALPHHTRASRMLSLAPTEKKVSFRYGVETPRT